MSQFPLPEHPFGQLGVANGLAVGVDDDGELEGDLDGFFDGAEVVVGNLVGTTDGREVDGDLLGVVVVGTVDGGPELG